MIEVEIANETHKTDKKQPHRMCAILFNLAIAQSVEHG